MLPLRSGCGLISIMGIVSVEVKVKPVVGGIAIKTETNKPRLVSLIVCPITNPKIMNNIVKVIL
tara:strand:+ start:322 stop:513 length:192 start_codon:yes stop_codon:yes gene_type:complete